ncbi:MAG: hypothetical protein ABI867_26945 [Kofleriaceae bacterium]
MARKPKPLGPFTIREAEARLRAALAGTRNNPADWRAFQALLQAVPEGVSHTLAVRVLAVPLFAYLAELPASLDAARLAFLEARERKDEDAAFVLGGVRAGGDIRDLITQSQQLPWASWTKRPQLAALIAKHQEYVAAAQAAVAIGGVHSTSRYLPILAIDGSRDSLDLFVPYLERQRRTKGRDADWFRKELVPLFAKTPATAAVIALLDDAVDKRIKTSPALAFVKRLGIDPPPALVQVTVSFRDDRGRVIFLVRVDSKEVGWCCGRRTVKWQWRAYTPGALAEAIPAGVATYIMRVSKGLDRAKLDAWVRSLLASAAARTRPSSASRRRS